MSFVSTKALIRSALIGALYISVTYALQPISFGPVQVRVSEALTVLPIIYPEAIPALWLGALLSNLFFGGLGLWDVLGGSTITLVAAICTFYLRKSWLAYAPPIVFNAFGVSYYLSFLLDLPYWPLVPSIAAGQTVAVLGVGFPLLRWIRRSRVPFLQP